MVICIYYMISTLFNVHSHFIIVKGEGKRMLSPPLSPVRGFKTSTCRGVLGPAK